jgi:hypothetical protein
MLKPILMAILISFIASLASAAGDTDVRWGAFAYGEVITKGKTFSNMFVLNDIKDRDTAEHLAQITCNGQLEQHSSKKGAKCKLVGSFKACQYIVMGSSKPGKPNYYGWGPTKEIAMEQCEKHGNTCDETRMTGGCNKTQ